ncbi:MAG TPA: arginine--tRNA ligase, partial [Gemmata sp.]|nr:arginine--tRNA ligase [Gemmata sp.]
MNLLTHVRSLFAPVLAEVAPDRDKLDGYLAAIKPSTFAEKPKGKPLSGASTPPEESAADYQANFAMALAKALDVSARKAAELVFTKLPTDILEATIVSPKESVAFINLRLKPEFLAKTLQQIATDPKLGVEPAAKPRTFVIDLSGPNVAKPLHVGHLRSTIIGDSLVRILRFLGHTVVGDNHLGDWGTQFGILLYGYKHHRDDAAFAADPVRELLRLYIHVRQLAKLAEGEDEDG